MLKDLKKDPYKDSIGGVIKMDFYRLIGRIVIASIITGIVAVPLMFLLLGSLEQWPILVILLVLVILIGINRAEKNK